MRRVRKEILKNRVYEDGHELFIEYLLADDLSVKEVHITADTKEGKAWLHDNYGKVLDRIAKDISG